MAYNGPVPLVVKTGGTGLATITNHSVLIGKGTSAIVGVGPVASTGAILASNGVGSDPGFTTATYPLTTTINQILYSSAANTIGGISASNNGVLISSATGVPSWLAAGTTGQILIATTGSPASWSTPGGTTIVSTLTGNSGGAISPTAGNINTVGTGSITISGSGSTLTTQLTGLTNHAIQIGAGTATLTQLGSGSTGQILQTNTTADPTWSTATYPSVATGTGTILRADGTNWVPTTATYPATTTINQILYSSSANVIGGITTANNGALVTSNTGVPTILAGPGTTGNILQSNAAAAPSFSTATYPSIATGTGTILRADGTNWVATTATYPATTTINQLLFSSANNVVGGITAANNGTLISGTTGVPSWLANGTTGQVLTATTGSPPSWGAAPGTGDVVGPGSATDNAIARFDGTTGKLIQNSTVTIGDTGIIDDSNSISGATLSFTLSNTSNTASSNALHQITVAGTSAGDAFSTYTVAATTNWSLGVDNSVTGDPFVVAASTALGTTNIMSALTSGEINFPLQTSFFAYLGTTDTNATGNGTAFTIGSGNAMTVVFDQNSDFATTGIFTAPVTGRYFLQCAVLVTGITSLTGLNYDLTTSNRLIRSNVIPIGTTAQQTISVLCDMDAADTAKVVITLSDTGGKVDDIFGVATNPYTFFSGNLEC